MFTSDKNEIMHYADSVLHDAFIFLTAGIACALFGLIYEIFSHEVYSFYMIYAFLILLVPGALLNLVIAWLAVRKEKHLRIKEAAARSAENVAFAENLSADLLNISDAAARSTANTVFKEEAVTETCYELSNGVKTPVSTGVLFPGRFTRLAWNSGLAVLTIGSIFKGILDIYGTTNKLIVVYPAAAAILLCAAVFSFSMSCATIKKMQKNTGISAV